MIPGFVTAYRDDNDYVHLYFYPGLDDNNNHIFRDIDLSQIKFKYKIEKHVDNSVDYKFLNRNIIKLYCRLLTFTNNEIRETIYI